MESPGRLKWQCRRGTLELDIMLERYLSQCYCHACEAEQTLFSALLALEDKELFPYLMGDRLPESEQLATLIDKIRQLGSETAA